MAEPRIGDLHNKCSWCGNTIQDDEDYFGFGARASDGMVLADKAGQFVSLNLSLIDKTVVALVASETDTPALADHDLLFITCSEDCAENLKEALDLERDVFSDD